MSGLGLCCCEVDGTARSLQSNLSSDPDIPGDSGAGVYIYAGCKQKESRGRGGAAGAARFTITCV